MSFDARLGGQLEQLLRNWMDDDSAVDVAIWIVTDPDAVAEAALKTALTNDGSGLVDDINYCARLDASPNDGSAS